MTYTFILKTPQKKNPYLVLRKNWFSRKQISIYQEIWQYMNAQGYTKVQVSLNPIEDGLALTRQGGIITSHFYNAPGQQRRLEFCSKGLRDLFECIPAIIYFKPIN